MENSQKLTELKNLIRIALGHRVSADEPSADIIALQEQGLVHVRFTDAYHPDRMDFKLLTLTPKGQAYIELLTMVNLPEPRTVYTSNVAVLNAESEPYGLVLID